MKKCLPIFKFFSIVFALMLMASVANAADRYSVATGNWNSTATWSATSGGPSGASAPVAADNAIIQGGFIVTVSSTVACTNLTVGTATTGTLRIGDGTARTITVSGNVTVASTGTITIPNFNDTHTFNIGGNLSNAGVFDMNTAADDLCNVVFNGTANQTVSGAGATTDFNLITINNTGAANNNIVEISSSAFTVPAGFLTLTAGIFKLSGSFALINIFFPAAAYTIPVGAGFWLNNVNATVSAQNGDVTLNGSLRVSTGTYNVGNAAGDDLRYDDGSSVTIDGGTLNIAAAFAGVTSVPAETTTFNMSSGTMLLSTVADGNNSNNRSSFDMRTAVGSSFTMSGGTIIIEATNSGTAGDYRNLAATVNITGGTLQFGNATTGTADDNFVLVGTGPYIMPTLSIVDNATSVPTLTLSTGGLTVRGNLTINAGTSLLAGGFPVSITGNFTSNGTFTPGTQTTTFNGTGVQSIRGSSAITFSSITFNNTIAGSTIAIIVDTMVTVTGTATFTDGIVSTSATEFISFPAGSAATGAGLSQATDASYVVGPVLKTGTTGFVFPVGSLVTASGGGYMPLTITGPDNLADAFSCEYTRGNATLVQTNGFTSPILNVSRCDYWNLNETNDAGSATSISVTLSWDAGSPCNGNFFITNFNALTVAHYNSGTSKWEQAGTGGPAPAGSNTTGTVTRTGVSSFSPFSLGNTSIGVNPLPVTFSDVKAFEKGTGVQIEWSNLTEKDLVNYTVERSASGRDFTAINQVAPRSNQNDKESYISFDASPFAGANFYRIKTVEIDGKITYSKVLKVEIGKITKGIVLYPNPVTGSAVSISFTAAKGQYTLQVLNNAGQTVYSKQLVHPGGTVSQSVELPSSLKTGVYNLMLSGDNYKENKMFIMQ